jgi:hypothetical protein
MRSSAWKIVVLLVITLGAACPASKAPPAPPSTSISSSVSPSPSPSPSPSAGDLSSQQLIAGDLEAGVIDYGTSLVYRAWALFRDPRLPARYDGAGSIGEDEILLDEIRAALPDLPSEQRSELKGYLARPTSPLSPFGPADATVTSVQAAASTTKCVAPNQWLARD